MFTGISSLFLLFPSEITLGLGLVQFRSATWIELIQSGLGVLLLILWSLTPPGAYAVDAFPSFHVHANIITRSFSVGTTNLISLTDALTIFGYSNGWWQVEVNYTDPESGLQTYENCRNVPDGIRFFTLFKDDARTGMTAAVACPISFPPPGRMELFAGWLSLCPQPEIPIIDSTRMRRFLNLPTCNLRLFNHAQNLGTYTAKYLDTGLSFLSELSISNNGMILDIGGDNQEVVERFPIPFENGFLEFRYEVLETTNFGGRPFPLRATAKWFSPNWSFHDRADLYVARSTEIIVRGVTSLDGEFPRQSSTPKELFAFDLRPPKLPTNIVPNYVVRNDLWKRASDPEIIHLANMARSAGKDPRRIRGWAALVITITILLPAVFIFWRKPNKQETMEGKSK